MARPAKLRRLSFLALALAGACQSPNSQAQLDTASQAVAQYCACVLEAVAGAPTELAARGEQTCSEERAKADEAWAALPNQESGEQVQRLRMARQGCEQRLSTGRGLAESP